MNKITTIGLDTAKSIFHIIACNTHGKIVLKKTLRRKQLLEYFANLESCLVGLEACSNSHHWGRELIKLGHTVKLIPAQHVKPYLQGNKNDYNDALAIAKAVVHPQMRFVAIKTIAQQDQGLISHKRQEVIDARTQLVNRIRAMLCERGNCRLRSLIIHGARSVVSNISDKQDPLSKWLRQLVLRVGIHKATVAYANKMIRMGWAVTRFGTPYDPDHAVKFNLQNAQTA